MGKIKLNGNLMEFNIKKYLFNLLNSRRTYIKVSKMLIKICFKWKINRFIYNT